MYNDFVFKKESDFLMINSVFLTLADSLNATYSILFLILAYLIGSIPFGIVIGKGICHIDIREHGSKNIGSTNAIRVFGKKVGFLVFLMVVFKGIVVLLIVKILGMTGAWESPIDPIFYGVAAIIGHSFSIFLKFKGGKAVATSLGVVFVISPLAAILCLIAFYITLKTSGYVSLASTFATFTVLITVWVLYGCGLNASNFLEYFINKQTLATGILVSFMATLIILKHRKNYIRLLNGTENSFKKKKENN